MWRVRACVFLFFLFLGSGLLVGQIKDEAELKKAAKQAFEDEEWGQGFKLYSTLVSNYPKDPEYNYRLGVCALFSEEDKKKSLTYLEFASKREKEVDKEVFFYLGKAYHLNYRFDDAMKYYTLYKQNASSSMQKKLQVDREIQCCKNAKRLLSNVRELVILDKKRLNQADYFRSYDLRDIRGKLLVKPSDFASPNDKKKKERSVIYLPPSKDQLYYSSYGTGENKDIYVVNRLPSGEWGKPQPLPGDVNTEFDEDYPFLHPNGVVLYFASKGHNSMGGYDVFKSEYDGASQKWKAPVNLDFPINSPSDDYLFVTDSLEKLAFLASTRQSPWGKTDVFKILTERRAAEFAFISGTVVKKTPSKIKVKNIESGEDVGTFTADANGEYNIKLSNGGKFIFTVETPGLPTQSAGVDVPTSYSYKPYRQTIDYDNQKLVINNFFEANDADDNNYTKYLALLEEKSKMNVNASDFDVNPDNPYDAKNNITANTNTTVTTNTSVATNSTVATNTATTVATNTTTAATHTTSTGNVSNKQLIDIAYSDAKEAQEEANNLKNDASNAFKAANSKQDQLNETKQDLQDAQNKANTETDPAKKQVWVDLADKLRQEVDLYDKQAKTANTIAQQLQVDADNKQKEANLNQEYAKALEEADKTRNNKQAIAKLESLQKQLEDLSKQKSGSDALVESIKADAKNKEQELTSAEKKQEKLDRDESDIKSQIADIDQQITKTKDKGLLDNLNAQKEELNSDLAEKQKESQTNKSKITDLKEESDALNSQVDYATSIAAGKTPAESEVKTSPTNTVVTNTTVATNTLAATNTVNPANTNSVVTTNTVAATNTLTTNPVETNTTTSIGTNTTAVVETNTTVATTNTNTAVETNTVNAYVEKTKQLDESLASLTNTQTNSLDDNKKKSDLLTQYVQATDAEIKEKKQELTKTKDADQKKALTSEIKQLTDKKTELQKEEKLVTTQVKEQEKQVAIAAKNNKVDTAGKTNTTVAYAPVSDTSQARIVNDRDDPRMQNINSLIALSQTGIAEEKQAFAKTQYTDQKAIQLKTQADNKLNELSKSNAALDQQLEELKMEIAKENAASNDKKIQGLSKQADDLSAQALQLRKDAKNMSGGDKQNALSTILALEKQATGFRYQAARLQYMSDDDNFETNKQAITQMTSGEYQGTQVQQAIELSKEAEKSKKDASRLREEAEAQKEIEAKIGALSNADEKEKEALKKQEDALALLKQINPQKTTTQLSPEKKTADLQIKLDKETQMSVNALKLLADANKAEYTALLNEVNKKEKASGTKPQADEFKNKAQEIHKNANDEYNKLSSAKEEKQKRQSLLDINNKFGDAIFELQNAKRVLNGEEILAANTNTLSVTTNSVTPNTNTVTVSTNTVDTNPENTNPVTTNTTSVTTNTTTVGTNTTSVASNTISVTTNTVEANNAASTNTVVANTNTVVSNNTQSSGTNLTEKQKEEIKSSPEYKQYATLQNEVVKYNNQVIKDESASKEYRNKYTALQNEIAAMPEGEQKTAKEKEAEQVKIKADSLQEVANNTRLLADSKKQESDTYGQNLDKTTYNNIVAVAATDNSTNTNPALQKYASYSEPFRVSANQKDEKLTELRGSTGTPENLKEQNQVIDAYVRDIDSEITAKKKLQAATTNAEEKKQIAQQVNNLQIRKNELLNEKKTNDNIIRFASNKAANTAGTGTVAVNNNTNIVNSNTVAVSNNTSSAAVKGNGFEVKTGNAYSATNPIPVNERLPEGLVFRVQIGAFKTAIDPARFAGLSPVGAETTNFGFIRYQVGMFTDYQQANAVKNDLRKLKYSDAFVVPYLNGKRISLGEALDMMTKQGVDVTTNANSSAGITVNSNIPVNPEPSTNTSAPVNTQGNLDSFNGAFYTVQIGVFGNNVSAAGLRNLGPIFREALPTGYYRYTAGIYSNYDKVLADRKKVVDLGIKDAFVSGYLNGKRQSVNEALPAGMQFLPERPIVFPSEGGNQTLANPAINNNVQPVSNGVTEGPAPTPENGVKTTDEGITFKVQIGAYSRQVPVEVVNNWLKIKTWPIKNTVVNNLYVYTVGSFSEARFAKKLRDEVIALGMNDAYVVVYKDGKKLYGPEAAQYLNR